MSTSSLRRQVKNIVHNYSEAEVKVREATSNDPWGPSTALMGEIADLTYNVTAFAEIMGMLWRRLNDHGRNWRHVYKALALAEYLVKTGSERVARQCRENVYAVQTLRDFQYVDRDGRDQGVNVREKAKQLVALLKDDARLQEERAQALRTKEKLAQASAAVLASAPAPAPAPMGPLVSGAPIEQAWPQSTGEEELQLQLALAMSKEEAQQRSPDGPAEDLQMQLALTLSKEEHDKEERLRRGDDLRLQMAIEESQKQNVGQAGPGEPSLMELADIFAPPAASGPPPSNDPWAAPPPAPATDPWGAPTPAGTTAGPWGAGPVPRTPAPLSDSWGILGAQPTPPVPVDSWVPLPPPSHQPAPTLDPWAPLTEPPSGTAPPAAAAQSYETLDAKADEDDFAEFDTLRATPVSLESTPGELDLLAEETPVLQADGVKTPDLFDLSPIEASSLKPIPAARKTPESFLGPNAALVDLDALVSSNVKTSNPFLSTGGSTPSSGTNPFSVAPLTQSLSLNQLRASPVLPPPGATPLLPAPSVMPTPVAAPVPLNGFAPHPAVPVTTMTNPFLL